MRRVSIASCLVAATWCVTSLNACSSGDSTPEPAAPTASIHLKLEADASDPGRLKLMGAPTDPKYVGIYPNPELWTSIDFVIGRDGIPATRCTRDGKEMQCSETPFFVEITRHAAVAPSGGSVGIRTYGTPPPPASDAGAAEESAPAPAPEAAPPASSAPAPAEPPTGDGGTVHVYDVNGKEVATTELGSAPPAGGGGAGSTCGGTAVGGAPGQGGFAKNGETGACAAASLADTPGCDGSTVAAAAKVYCDAVNAQLPAADKIDCATLTDPAYVPSAIPDSRSGGDCSTYWEPARGAVSASPYASCKKVSLLLTQWRDRSRHELISNGVCRSSPLVLDLDGDGIHLSSLDQGVKFDLLGGGAKVWSSWTDGKDALLALDRSGNGQIDGASELFGNVTGDRPYDDGFAALAQLDQDGNGAIDARDAAFAHLLLWRDANRDGVSTPAELTTLSEAGVRRLAVTPVRRGGASSLDEHGNSIPLVATFERRDGTQGVMVDAFLRFKPVR